MRKSWLLAALLVVLGMALPVKAQDTSKFNVYVGYDYVHAQVSNTSFGAPSGFSTLNFNGGSIQGAYNVLPYLAAVAEFGGYYEAASPVFGGSYGPAGVISYMFGPRLNISRGRVSPYVQVLMGASTLGPAIASKTGAQLNSGTDTEFSMTAGGGVDVALSRRIAIRPAQVEYYLTRFYTCTLGPPAANCTGIVRSQNNFRFSAGVVFRFGGK